eukprot:8443498-Lingulodinium_polyedra.AAC.1
MPRASVGALRELVRGVGNRHKAALSGRRGRCRANANANTRASLRSVLLLASACSNCFGFARW